MRSERSLERGVAVRQPRFAVFPDVVDASYSQRYQLLMSKLVRERLYDSACFLMSSRDSGTKRRYTHPEPELSFVQFAASLTGRIASHLAARRGHGAYLGSDQLLSRPRRISLAAAAREFRQKNKNQSLTPRLRLPPRRRHRASFQCRAIRKSDIETRSVAPGVSQAERKRTLLATVFPRKRNAD